MNPLASRQSRSRRSSWSQSSATTFFLVGRTASGAPAPSASPTVSPTVVPTATPTPPTATPAASQGVRPLPDGLLAAGTYSLATSPACRAHRESPCRAAGRYSRVRGAGRPHRPDAPLGARHHLHAGQRRVRRPLPLGQGRHRFDEPARREGRRTDRRRPGRRHPREHVVHLDDADGRHHRWAPREASWTSSCRRTSASRSCDKEKGDTSGTIFLSPTRLPLYAQGPGNRWHLSIIDVNGSRLIVVSFDYAGTPADVQADAHSIVDSIKFSKSDPSPAREPPPRFPRI